MPGNKVIRVKQSILKLHKKQWTESVNNNSDVLKKPLRESFDLYFVLCLNSASSLELCLFQYFCLTLSKFLRINDAISSVFVFILLFYCVFFSAFVFLYYLLFPAFALFYYMSLVRQLIFPVLVISLCI